MTETGPGVAVRWMESLWLDVRFAVRRLLQAPGIAAAALLALALGIGANTAVFSLTHASLWRDPPFRSPERLVTVWQEIPTAGMVPVTLGAFNAWRARSRSFEGLASISQDPANLTAPGEPALISLAWVSGGFFEVLDVRMDAGRGLQAADAKRKARVAVVSRRFFQERYGGDPSRLGQKLVLEGARYEVVGVAPPELDLFAKYDVWLPDVFRPAFADPNFHSLRLVGRLRSGATLERADRELEAVSLELAKKIPDVYEGLTVLLVPLPNLGSDQARWILTLLALLVVCTLLIACADVAGLLLARATGRESEIALRAALGATRGRLARGLLVESLTLFLAGGLLSLPVAVLALKGLLAIDPNPPAEVGLHGGTLLFTLGVSLATGLLSGLAPALAVTGRRLAESLKDARRLAGRPAGRWTRDLLVAAQVGLTVVLLVGAGLLKQSFDQLRQVDPGFQVRGLLTSSFQLPVEKYGDPGARARLFAAALKAVRGASGVESATLAYPRPFDRTPRLQFTVEGVPFDTAQNPLVKVRRVTPGYFETMGIPLVRGRAFRDSEGSSTPRVAIVNETMAERFWPGKNPIGKRFSYGYGSGVPESPDFWMTVVGVAKNTREWRLDAPEGIMVYSLLTQELSDFTTQSFTVLARGEGDPYELAEPLLEAVREVDPGLAGTPPRSLEDVAAKSLAFNRFWSLLTLPFAVLALMLAVAGIYGVVSYSVAQRTHETGVRMALGADAGEVLRRLILQGMAPVVAGLILGLGAARLTSVLLARNLYEVQPGDPRPYVLAAGVILTAALIATYFPAYRATQVDPVTALRDE